MKKITIIDYGCGNLLSLSRAIEFLGYESETTRDTNKIINSSHVILPGVGAFGNAMKKIEENTDFKKNMIVSAINADSKILEAN